MNNNEKQTWRTKEAVDARYRSLEVYLCTVCHPKYARFGLKSTLWQLFSRLAFFLFVIYSIKRELLQFSGAA